MRLQPLDVRCPDDFEAALRTATAARAEALLVLPDLMIIGKIGLAELAPALRRTEKRLSRAVNPTLYACEEFGTKLRARDHFLASVLDGARLFILGDPHELAAATGQSPGTDT